MPTHNGLPPVPGSPRHVLTLASRHGVPLVLFLCCTAYLLSCPVLFLTVQSLNWDVDALLSSEWYTAWNYAVDKTPLKEPLLQWCSVLGVRDVFEAMHEYRRAKKLYQQYGDTSLQYQFDE
ncbi:hypothetical protein AB1L42_23475 [Thalassoglobus sp. JC818]|uniref:hypothetical protein n=1 Tax=Thalassoglobus sp. JC818 TaxID=3232136 RepID=UPI0034595DFB